MQTLKNERTSFPEAVKNILDTLEKRGDGISITSLARETNLNRRTVEKALNLLESIQEALLDKKLDVTKMERTKIIRFRNTGLLGLPENIQKLIIRTAYFPTPSREEEILVFMQLRNSASPKSALKIERSKLLEKLLKQGQILESSDGRFYLSDEGQTVANGALKLYPELQNVEEHH
jgi:predicted transcriptional regulator